MKIECEKVEHIRYSTTCGVKKYCCKQMEHAMTCLQDWSWGGKNSRKRIHKTSKYGYTMCAERGGIKLQFVQNDDYSSRKEIEPTSGLILYCPFCGEMIE